MGNREEMCGDEAGRSVWRRRGLDDINRSLV